MNKNQIDLSIAFAYTDTIELQQEQPEPNQASDELDQPSLSQVTEQTTTDKAAQAPKETQVDTIIVSGRLNNSLQENMKSLFQSHEGITLDLNLDKITNQVDQIKHEDKNTQSEGQESAFTEEATPDILALEEQLAETQINQDQISTDLTATSEERRYIPFEILASQSSASVLFARNQTDSDMLISIPDGAVLVLHVSSLANFTVDKIDGSSTTALDVRITFDTNVFNSNNFSFGATSSGVSDSNINLFYNTQTDTFWYDHDGFNTGDKPQALLEVGSNISFNASSDISFSSGI